MRLSCLVIVAVLVACGSDKTGPSDVFSGTWAGVGVLDAADTLVFQFDAAQSGSALLGNGIVALDSASNSFTYTGTSAPPALTMTLSVTGGGVATFTGTYVTRDSVAGTIIWGSVPVALGLKKQ